MFSPKAPTEFPDVIGELKKFTEVAALNVPNLVGATTAHKGLVKAHVHDWARTMDQIRLENINYASYLCLALEGHFYGGNRVQLLLEAINNALAVPDSLYTLVDRFGVTGWLGRTRDPIGFTRQFGCVNDYSSLFHDATFFIAAHQHLNDMELVVAYQELQGLTERNRGECMDMVYEAITEYREIWFEKLNQELYDFHKTM